MSFDGDESYESEEGIEEPEADENTELMDSDEDQIESEEEPEETSAPEDSEMPGDSTEEQEVSPETRAEINEKSEYSSEVNDHIHSVEELEVYQKAGLKEENIDGRTCLIRENIDYDYVDEKTEKTNRELMKEGRAPYDAETGERIELHHIGQDYDSPLAELTSDSEHGDGNHSVLHTKESDSWRNDTEKNNHYNGVQRPNHWKARA